MITIVTIISDDNYVPVSLLKQKRGREYGVRAPVLYGDLREKTAFHEYLQEACFVLTEIFEHLRKPPGVYRIM